MDSVDIGQLAWRTALSCNHGACVEVAPLASGVAIRSSKNPGPVILYDTGEWRTFIEGVKQGDFDDTL